MNNEKNRGQRFRDRVAEMDFDDTNMPSVLAAGTWKPTKEHMIELLEKGISSGLREDFCYAFSCYQEYSGATDLELAEKFQLGLSTVKRWTSAEAAPHPVGRKPILEYLLKCVKENV